MRLEGTVAKLDQDKQLVFGWANVVEHDGRPLMDRQGDFIDDSWELEKAAYDYVLKSRDGGEMHVKRGVGTMVESFVVTPEKLAKMGLPNSALPTGWWIGFKVHDADVWQQVKKGGYTGFSIAGSGKRQKVEVDMDKMSTYRMAKATKRGAGGQPQPYDEAGKYTSGRGGAGAGKGSGRTRGKTLPDKNGVYHTDDVDEAAELLARGKKVELGQPRQVSTLVHKLAAMVQEAKAKGEDAPNYDLCNVSVKGTNVFCSENKGIRRLNMPQIKGKAKKGSRAEKFLNDEGEADGTEEFIKYLEGKGVKVTQGREKASFLRATQSELVGAKVAGMVTAAEAGKFDPGAGKIFVSREGYVLDGHHRWAAVVGLDAGDDKLGDLDIGVYRIDMSIEELVPETNAWSEQFGILPKVAKRLLQYLRAQVSKGYITEADYQHRLVQLMAKRDVSEKERGKLAEKGRALPDGSFPIANVSDLRNAIQAVGRAKSPVAARKHIIRSARRLGRTDLIPSGWAKS